MPQHIESIGHIATLACASVQCVRKIITEIGAQPVLVINGIEHYAAEVVGTIIARVEGWTDQPAYNKRYDVPEVIQG